MDVAEGHGTTLLTATQAAQLWTALDHLPLRGPVAVAVVDNDLQFRTPGQALNLHIGDTTVHIPTDHTHRPPPPFDPAPLGFMWAAVLAVHDLFPNSPHQPVALVAAASTAYLAGALWAHRLLIRRGQRARPTILSVFLAIGATYGLLGLLTMGQLRSPADHGPFVVTTGTLIGPAIVAGFYWTTIATSRRLAVVATVATLIAAEVTLSPAHPSLQQIAVAAIWPLAAFLSGQGMGQALETSAAKFDQALQTQARKDKQRRYADGWNSVVRLVSEARDDAHTALESSSGDIPQRHRIEVNRRLERIDQCLEQLRNGSSSSTTTKSPATDSPPASPATTTSNS
jgi:hypothetical protein